MRGARREDGEEGFVLLSVLLAVALFMTAAASFAIKSRLAALQAGNRLEQAHARALVDGALLFAVDALGAARSVPRRPAAGGTEGAAAERAPPLPFAGDGTLLSCALSGERRVEISVVDQAGLLDLNAASPEMIVDVLGAAGLGGEQALQLAGAIADFRDGNDVPEAGGASEAALYREAGKPFGPRDGPFFDVADIAQLPAFTPDLAGRLRPLFTVRNGHAGLDIAVMDRRARRLFPEDPAALDPLTRWRRPTDRTAFAIETVLRRADGTAAAARHGLVTFGEGSADAPAGGPDRPRPPRIREWRETLVSPADPVPPSASPLCRRLRLALEDDAAFRR